MSSYKVAEIRLTPDLARSWLETMPHYQRKASGVVVSQYARDMSEGRWVSGTGDVFRFDRQGRMIDGQHRCLAVIESGVTIDAPVLTGLDESVYKVIDKGRKRSVADVIGGTRPTIRAAMAKSLLLLQEGVPAASLLAGGNHGATPTEIAEYALAHQSLINVLVGCYGDMARANGGRISAAVVACIAAHACEIGGNIRSFERFCEELNKPVSERPVVLTMARERASSFTITRGRSKNAHVFAIYAIAYRHWLAGTTPRLIQTSSLTKGINNVPLRRNWEDDAA